MAALEGLVVSRTAVGVLDLADEPLFAFVAGATVAGTAVAAAWSSAPVEIVKSEAKRS